MAVYTEIADDQLIQFMADYEAGEVLSFKGIAEGIENSNFFVSTSEGSYILTLYEKRVDPNDLPFFLGLMEHLAAAGIPCPIPLATRAGDVLRELAERPAALISFLAGISVRRPGVEHCEQVGQILAMLHEAGASFELERRNALGPAAWPGLLDACRGVGDDYQAGLIDDMSDALDQITGDWPSTLPAGVIHADLFPDNVFFRQGHLSGVIDFYFACTDVLAYDLAVCLNAWCFESDLSFNVTKARKLLKGYQTVRTLSADEVAALPVLAQGAAMRFLLTRLYDWAHTPKDAFVTPKDPGEYVKKLRFHQAVKGPESYGLD